MAFGTAETAKLLIDLSLTGNFLSQLGKVNRALDKTGSKLDATQSRSYRAGQQIGTGIKRGALIAVSAIGTLTAALAFAVKQGQEAANVQKIFATAVTNSFKTAADQSQTLKDRIGKFQKALANSKPGSKAAQNLTAEIKQLKAQLANIGAITPAYVQALNDQQKALMNLAGVDDELIKSEQTRLIQMGLSGKATLKLTPLILDAAKATGKDLLTITIAAGKAANGNATALQRLGIVVDKTRFKVDPLAETIRVLNQRFGGTTKALSGSFDVRLAALRENLNNIAEDAGQKLLPALTRIVSVVGAKVVPALGKLVDRLLPEITKGLDEFATALENGAAEDAIRGITDALGPLVDLVKIAAAPVKAIVGAFLALPKEVQTVLVGAFAVNKLTGGLVTNIAGAIAGSIIRTPLVNVQGGVVNVGGGVPGAGGIGGKASGGGVSALGIIGSVLGGLAVASIWKSMFQDPEFQKQTDGIEKSAKAQIDTSKSIKELQTARGGVAQALSDLTVKGGPLAGPLNSITDVLFGGQKDKLRDLLKAYDEAIAKLSASRQPPGGSKTHPGKQQDDRVPKRQPSTRTDLERGPGKTGKQLDDIHRSTETTGKKIDDIVPKVNPKLVNLERATGNVPSRINPKLTDLDRSVDTSGQVVAGAIRQKDLSIDQVLTFNFMLPGAGTTTRVITLQNRAGSPTGSASRDVNMGNLGLPNGPR